VGGRNRTITTRVRRQSKGRSAPGALRVHIFTKPGPARRAGSASRAGVSHAEAVRRWVRSNVGLTAQKVEARVGPRHGTPREGWRDAAPAGSRVRIPASKRLSVHSARGLQPPSFSPVRTRLGCRIFANPRAISGLGIDVKKNGLKEHLGVRIDHLLHAPCDHLGRARRRIPE